MLKLPENESSYWRETSSRQAYQKLSGNMAVDVAVVGGGICGLTAAYLLAQAGLSVAVFEKDTIGSGTTGHTTGKVTSQHNLFYEEFKNRMGEDKAKMYASSNNDAITKIENIIKKERIDCAWQRKDHIVYTTIKSKTNTFKQEAKTATRLGLPASYVTKIDLPLKVEAAVRFTDQAKFNAQSYIAGLAVAISKNGGHIFENTRVSSLSDGRPASIRARGFRVHAKDIIVATNVPTFPLAARGTYCILEYPTTSYIIAVRAKQKLGAMYISPDEANYSIMPVPKSDLILVGGENHIRRPGGGDKRWPKLAAFAEANLDADKVAHKWSAWDYLAYDNIPLVGKLYPWSRHLYVATAFKKWGLTNTMVAAEILRDKILGLSNETASLYTPHRMSPVKSIPRVLASYISK